MSISLGSSNFYENEKNVRKIKENSKSNQFYEMTHAYKKRAKKI